MIQLDLLPLATTFTLLASLVGCGSAQTMNALPTTTAGADAVNAANPASMKEELSKHEIGVILEVNKDWGDHPLDGVSTQTSTVRFTNDDRTRYRNFMSGVANGEEGYGTFSKNCKTKPSIVYDPAILKIFSTTESLPLSQVLEGLDNLCSNPPNPTYVSFMQKIKRIHFYLADRGCKSDDPHLVGGYAMSLDSSGELRVGVTRSSNPERNPRGECGNIAVNTQAWVRKQ